MTSLVKSVKRAARKFYEIRKKANNGTEWEKIEEKTPLNEKKKKKIREKYLNEIKRNKI